MGLPHKQNTRAYYCYIYVYAVYTNDHALGYYALGHLAFKHELIVYEDNHSEITTVKTELTKGAGRLHSVGHCETLWGTAY